MEAVSTAAGIFNIASFAVGSGPEAVSRLNKALSMEEKYTEAQKHAAVVLETLETWGEYITRNEKDQLKSAYWQFKGDVNTYRRLQIDRKKSPIWDVIQKFKKEKKIRQTAQKMFDEATLAKDLAMSATEKVRFRRILSSPDSGPSSSATPAPNTPGTSALRMTNSMVSLVFRPPTEADDPAVIARLATPVIQVAAGQPREADPAVDREGNTSADHEGNPFDHEDLGVPLTRFETTDTAISTYSSTPLVVKG